MNNEYLQSEREIKGYVEIEYSDIDNILPIGAQLTYPSEAPICQGELITLYDGDKKVRTNYASLEEDYFLLDGSFVLPYKPDESISYHNKNVGYITDEPVAQLPDYVPLTIESISKEMYGMSLYFKDNIPATISLAFVNSNNENINFNIIDNTEDIISVKFDEKQTITSINITFSDFDYQNRRFRLSWIDYGLSDILKDSTLINFNIIENIGDLNLEFPSNQLTINLYDENDMFDITNPSGYADFLNEGLLVKAKPYIGIQTEHEGIKYDDTQATFYLQNWSSNKNEITLNCVDYLEKMKQIRNVDRVGEQTLDENTCEYLDVAFENITGIKIDTFKNFMNSQNYLNDWFIDTVTSLEYLKQLMIWLWGYIYNENDKLIINGRENTTLYNYTLSLENNLLVEPKYTVREKIKSVSIVQYKGYYVNDEKVWQAAPDIYLTNSERASQGNEIVELPEYHELHVEARNISQDIGINKVFNASDYTPVVISPPTNITFYDLGTCTFNTSTYVKQFNDNGKEITIDNKFFKETNIANLDLLCESICDKINGENKKYDVQIQYTGDPSIKPNMIVPIETQYGEKQVKVLRHTLTFNGGLTGTIEGVCD